MRKRLRVLAGAAALVMVYMLARVAPSTTLQADEQSRNDGLAINPISYGAAGDARICQNDASIETGQRVLTSTSARFTSADIGKPITVPGAGPPAMLGVGILSGLRSGTKVRLVLVRPAAAGMRIYARYWTSIRPVVDRMRDCAISAGGHVVTCSRQNFPAAYRRAIAVLPAAGMRDARTNLPAPLVSRINAVTATTLTLDKPAAAGASNQDLSIWLRYEEPHGATVPGQRVVAVATANTPLSQSLNVSVGSLDAVDVAATDLTTTIQSVSSRRSILAVPASITVRTGGCRFGTDDYHAFQTALDAAAKGPVAIAWPWDVVSAGGNGRVDVSPGHAYYVGSPLIFNGSNLELRASAASIYYGGTGTFLRLGEAASLGSCAQSALTANYHLDGLHVIGSLNAAAGIAVPCAGQTQIDQSLIQGFVENLDVGMAGAHGTSPDTKVTRTFLDRGIVNLWVHTADLFTFSDGGYYGYRDRGMVLCGDDNPDTLCHSMKIDSAQGAAHFLSAAAGLDIGNLDGFELRNIYDEPGVVQGLPEGGGPALRLGYIGSPHGGVVSGGTWSGNKVDTAVQFNAPGSIGVESDVAFVGNYLINWSIGFDLSGAKQIFAGPNRFEPHTVTGPHYAGINSTDSMLDAAVGSGPGNATQPADGAAIGTGTASAGPFFSFTTVHSASAKPLPACNAVRLHWRACVSDAPSCMSGRIYAGGNGRAPCELWCNGSNWIQSGSGC